MIFKFSRPSLLLVPFFISLGYSSVSAADIVVAPPALQSVMQKNERYDRLQILRDKRAPRTQSGSTNATGSTDIPLTYRTLQSLPSITISRANEADLWIQELDLTKGARLSSTLTLGGYDPENGEPLFQKKNLKDILTEQGTPPTSIINGQFFDPQKELTPLSFGLKVDGVVRTAGADNRDESKNILVLEEQQARIIPYSWENLRDAPGYLAMVNLSLSTPQSSRLAVGRTYICLENPTPENTSNKLVIFSAVSMTEAVIEKELPRFGCTRSGSTKLDSSGSTRLWLGGESIFGKNKNNTPDYRKIPHYLAVLEK